MSHHEGQAIAELALAFPILCGLLLGIVASGLYLLAATAQQGRTQTLADWAASNTTGDYAEYAVTLTDCPCSVVELSEGTTLATITCPSVAGAILPGILPDEIVTTATSYRRTDE